MNRKLGFVVFIIFIITIWTLSSCKVVDSYEDFHIQSVDDYGVEDYFSAEELDFARVNNVLIRPVIKEINHYKYRVYLTAYSQTGSEKVTINKIYLEKDSKVCLTNEEQQEVLFDEKLENAFKGVVNAGEFVDRDISDKNTMNIIVQVQVENETETITKDINFHIDITQYRSVVMPT